MNQLHKVWRRETDLPGVGSWLWYPGASIQLPADQEQRLEETVWGLCRVGLAELPDSLADWLRWQWQQVRIERRRTRLNPSVEEPDFLRVLRSEITRRRALAGLRPSPEGLRYMVEVEGWLRRTGRVWSHRMDLDQLRRQAGGDVSA